MKSLFLDFEKLPTQAFFYFYLFVSLFATFAEYGTQQEHMQQDTWSLLGPVPFVGEEVTVHNTDIILLLSTSVGSFKSSDRTSRD